MLPQARKYASGLLTSLLVLAGTATALAQQDQPAMPDSGNEEAPTPLPAGTECAAAPQFGFTWLDTDVAGFLVSGKQTKPIIVTIEYLETPRLATSKMTFKSIEALGNAAENTACWQAAAAEADAKASEAKAETGAPEAHTLLLKQRTLAGAQARAQQRSASGPITLCVQPTEPGTMVPLFLDRRAVLKAGGFVGVSYFSTEKAVPAGCEKKLAGVVPVKAMQKHRISFDAGPVFNLEGDGSFSSNAEVAVSARSQWSTWFEGGVAMRYSALGAIAEGDDATAFNPFTDGGGVFESNFYGTLRPSAAPWVGLAVGAGLTTVPGAAGSALEARERRFFAFRTAVQGYNAGEPANRLGNSSGFMQAGFLKDQLFEDVILDPAHPEIKSDESDRWFLEGEIELPRVGTEWARISLRAFASLPKSGDGPSDIRISALVSIDPRSWFPGLKGKGLDLQ